MFDYTIMDREKLLAVLFELTTECRKSAKIYQKALALLKNTTLAPLLLSYAKEREQFADVLVQLACDLDADEEPPGKSKLQLVEEIQDSNPNSSHRSEVIAWCERAEQRIEDCYKKALVDPLPEYFEAQLRAQHLRIRQTHQWLLSLNQLMPSSADHHVLLAALPTSLEQALTDALKQRGVASESSAGAGEAVYRAMRHRPTAVVVDQRTLESNAEALAALREGNGDLPIIAVNQETPIEEVLSQLSATAASLVNADRRPQVLIVDDDDELRSLMVVELEEQGFEVGQACDGQDALIELNKKVYDVVLLDLMMPRMSGIGFLSHIQDIDSPPAIVIYSAYVDTATESYPHVSAVLRKTTNIDTVIDTLKHSVRKSGRASI